MYFLWNVLKIIFLLGFLITIHELGHFLVAKACKVRVNEFSIGFGPNLWKKQGKQTKYSIRLIPLGGYVSMEGEEEHSDEEGSFTKASVLKRVLIVIAGATVNILFAIIVYFILSATSGEYVTTIIDGFVPGYAAEESAQLQKNDEIIKVNNKNVNISTDVNEILENCNGEKLNIEIKRNGKTQIISIVPTEQKYKSTGIYLYQLEQKSTKVAGVAKNSPAEKSGLETGDTITYVNSEYVKDNPEKLIEILRDSNLQELNLKVDKKGKELEIKIIPEEASSYYLGVIFKRANNNFANKMYYGWLDTKEFITSILQNLKQLFTGKVSSDQLMGPVGISEVVAKTSGFRDFVYMLALISLSLGVTNLIPFPPLDGGKVLFLIIEAIRRKPIKQETEAKIQLLGFAILILLSVYVTYNDILRIL